jgi:hypothetical protein
LQNSCLLRPAAIFPGLRCRRKIVPNVLYEHPLWRFFISALPEKISLWLATTVNSAVGSLVIAFFRPFFPQYPAPSSIPENPGKAFFNSL